MKKFVSLCISLFLICLTFQNVYADDSLKLNSQYAYLYDPQTSLVYMNQGSDERIYPASMTKILTVKVALEKISDLKEKVKVEKVDYNGLFEANASIAWLDIGEVVTYEDLLYGALLPSGADACQALARLTYGSLDAFVEAMNKKIESLGLQNTHFSNVTGLHDDDHYTTPKEMAFILNDALSDSRFVPIFEARNYTSSNKRHQWSSTLERAALQKIDISHIDGAKSGFTDEALLTLASTMTIDGHQLILVTAKASGQYSQNHVKDAVSTYNYMQNHYHRIDLYKKDQEIADYWILDSLNFHYHYTADCDISILTTNDISHDDLSISIEAKKVLKSPINEGTSVGEVHIDYQNESLYHFTLNIKQTIQRNMVLFVLRYVLLIFVIFYCRRKLCIKIRKRKRRTSH